MTEREKAAGNRVIIYYDEVAEVTPEQRRKLVAYYERRGGKAWCKLKGLRFVDVNELGVWYARTVAPEGKHDESHGCCSWAEVFADLASLSIPSR